MKAKSAGRKAIRIASAGHAAFAATMIALGIQGLIKGDFTAVWQPVPKGVPGREILVYLCASISLASGIGLLWRRTAALASLVEGTWSLGETMVMTAGAWVLYAAFSTDRDRKRVGFATGDNGMRVARVLYGLGLIPFGYAHFANVRGTAGLVPGWLPWHTGWAYFTGAAFLAAGVAVLIGVCGWLAAALSALQMGLFGLLVWVPILAAGNTKAFQWLELATTVVLTAAGWVVADSYRRLSWLNRG